MSNAAMEVYCVVIRRRASFARLLALDFSRHFLLARNASDRGCLARNHFIIYVDVELNAFKLLALSDAS